MKKNKKPKKLKRKKEMLGLARDASTKLVELNNRLHDVADDLRASTESLLTGMRGDIDALRARLSAIAVDLYAPRTMVQIPIAGVIESLRGQGSIDSYDGSTVRAGAEAAFHYQSSGGLRWPPMFQIGLDWRGDEANLRVKEIRIGNRSVFNDRPDIPARHIEAAVFKVPEEFVGQSTEAALRVTLRNASDKDATSVAVTLRLPAEDPKPEQRDAPTGPEKELLEKVQRLVEWMAVQEREKQTERAAAKKTKEEKGLEAIKIIRAMLSVMPFDAERMEELARRIGVDQQIALSPYIDAELKRRSSRPSQAAAPAPTDIDAAFPPSTGIAQVTALHKTICLRCKKPIAIGEVLCLIKNTPGGYCSPECAAPPVASPLQPDPGTVVDVRCTVCRQPIVGAGVVHLGKPYCSDPCLERDTAAKSSGLK